MSHNIEHFIYPDNVNKSIVQKDLDNYVAREDWQEGCTGLYNRIRWLGEKVYNTPAEAEKAIKCLDRGGYDCLAVRYYDRTHSTVGMRNDPKLNELEQKEKDAEKEMNRRGRILYPETVTATRITCKKCGSHLARSFLHSNFCPVCNEDLRPEHMRKSYFVAQKKWNKAKADTLAYIDKHCKKEIKWFVKIEYHT